MIQMSIITGSMLCEVITWPVDQVMDQPAATREIWQAQAPRAVGRCTARALRAGDGPTEVIGEDSET